MIKYIKNSDIPKYLTCPFCKSIDDSLLTNISDGLKCQKCKRYFRIKNNIVEFVRNEELDSETKRELKGNQISLSRENIQHYAEKDQWSNYYNHFVNQKFDFLMDYLNTIPMDGLISLGSGPGFELKQILKRKKIETIFSSDLAYSTTRVVPVALKNFNINLCLFTSDINLSPVISNDAYPILVYEALHHTGDIHMAIEKLLKKKFKNVFFVEPATNFVIKILAKFNLAQRVEYSGVKPDFVDINILKKIANKYKYNLKIKTLWDVPEDFIRVVCKKDSILQSILLKLIDIISFIGNKYQFGSFAIVHLERIK